MKVQLSLVTHSNLKREVRTMSKFKVEEHEGFSDRLIKVNTFPTQEEALKFWEQMRQMNRFAGVGGRWKHYYTYPEEIKEAIQ